jgi:glycosyltransferase involved in cell wall biosynthesis
VDSSGDIVAQMDRMCNAFVDRFAAVQELFGQFDIVHGHDWHPVPALLQIKQKHSQAFFLTMHSTEWGRNGNHFGYGISEEITHREWLGCFEAVQVIVTTRRMQDELMWIYTLPEDKIHIIPNGIILGKIRRGLDAGRVKEKYGIHPLSPLVLFCGRMSIQKGPDLLVEAVPRILLHRPDARFVFMGEGGMKGECARRAQELGVTDACRFLGYTSASDKEELVNACDLMCVPSRNEPFGVVVLEAWDACKPVVATEAVSIIKNFEDGLLAYVQPESIAWCINRLLANPDEPKRRNMSTSRPWNRAARWLFPHFFRTRWHERKVVGLQF